MMYLLWNTLQVLRGKRTSGPSLNVPRFIESPPLPLGALSHGLIEHHARRHRDIQGGHRAEQRNVG